MASLSTDTRMKIHTSVLGLLTLWLLVNACTKETPSSSSPFEYSDQEFQLLSQTLDLPRERHNYFVQLPPHSTNQLEVPLVNSIKATLGRVLFYDPRLSRDNSLSCGSCHQQAHAFADGQAKSPGLDGQQTMRNTLALGSSLNIRASNVTVFKDGEEIPPTLGWDGRTNDLQEYIRWSVEDLTMMGKSLDALADELEGVGYYDILFEKAYPGEKIKPGQILEALEHFLTAMVPDKTRFDEGLNNAAGVYPDFDSFLPAENLGKTLFMTHCADCHGPAASKTASAPSNNGLSLFYADNGVAGITGRVADVARFKVPFLRNIAVSGPYMHDGRFESLQAVVQHYSEDVMQHEQLDSLLVDAETGQARQLSFSEEEKTAIVSFLFAMTDQTFLQDERFSDPFK